MCDDRDQFGRCYPERVRLNWQHRLDKARTSYALAMERGDHMDAASAHGAILALADLAGTLGAKEPKDLPDPDALEAHR